MANMGHGLVCTPNKPEFTQFECPASVSKTAEVEFQQYIPKLCPFFFSNSPTL